MEDKAKRDLPGLREWAQRLLSLSNEAAANCQYPEEDDLGFMASCFLSKQIDHLESIVILVPRRDAVLVARSMIESCCQLLWAAQDPDTRPSQWRNFVWIRDWRVMKEMIARGETVDPETRSRIEDELRKSGDRYMKGKARKARDNGAPWPDPYHDDWRCGTTIWETCKSVGGEDLYRKIYKPFSDWQHGGVSKLGEAIKREGNRIVYSSYSPRDSATVLAVGFQCLLQTVEFTNNHLKMGLGTKISELHNNYIVWNKNR